MTAPPPTRGNSSKHRRRRVRTRVLVLLAVTASFLVLAGQGTAQILGHLSCSDHPVLVNVAVSTDIAPAIERIAAVFNRQQRTADGRCVDVQVTPDPPSIAAGQVDGQRAAAGQPRIDAWIPDSSLWVEQARGYAVGIQTVQPAGFSVARSPLMIVMPREAAVRTAAFGKVGWRLLLPRSAGGPDVPAGFRVDLPDPTQNAAGLAALIEITRLLGPGTAARVSFAKFVYSSAVTPYFDDPASLAAFVSLAAPPLDGFPVTVASEQAVVTYDEANPRQPLAATYPAGSGPAFGTPELDYPYVLTTANRPRLDAANLFGQMLRSRYAASVIRYSGFRSADGLADRLPASDGLNKQLLQLAPPAAPGEAPVALQAWNKIALESRDLTLLDVSAAMGRQVAPGGPTIEQAITKTATIGLSFFADNANLGLWEFADHLDGARPYKQLVPIGPLSASLGLKISRRTELQKINSSITPTTSQTVALYGSILAGYSYLLRTYQPRFYNAEIVLTAGLENAPGDITAGQLVTKLGKLANPARPVAIVIIVFGNSPVFGELQRIANSTGGQAYQITDPSQVARVFFQAIAHRLCSVGCVRA